MSLGLGVLGFTGFGLLLFKVYGLRRLCLDFMAWGFCCLELRFIGFGVQGLG